MFNAPTVRVGKRKTHPKKPTQKNPKKPTLKNPLKSGFFGFFKKKVGYFIQFYFKLTFLFILNNSEWFRPFVLLIAHLYTLFFLNFSCHNSFLTDKNASSFHFRFSARGWNTNDMLHANKLSFRFFKSSTMLVF